MASKHLGDLYRTLCDTEQELQSIFPKLEPEEQTMVKDLLHRVQSRLAKSIRVLTNNFDVEESTRTEPSCFTLTSPILTSLNSLTPQPRNPLG